MEPTTITPAQPWYFRLLEQHGISTFFACVLLYGGWQIFESHLEFVTAQSVQMKLQTAALDTIAHSSLRQEAAMDLLNESVETNAKALHEEHRQIIKELQK